MPLWLFGRIKVISYLRIPLIRFINHFGFSLDMNREPITLLIPPWGRAFTSFFDRLYAVTNDPRLPLISEAVVGSREFMSPYFDRARSSLSGVPDEARGALGIYPDPNHSGKYRGGFSELSVEVDGIPAFIRGAPSDERVLAAKSQKADAALAGLDEVMAAASDDMSTETEVTQWGAFNYSVCGNSPLRIAGSANLSTPQGFLDIVGVFLITGKRDRYEQIDALARRGEHFLVKNGYEEAFRCAFGKSKPFPLQFEPVRSADAIVRQKPGRYGLEVVQTGKTLVPRDPLAKNTLMAIGWLMNSETLYVVNRGAYLERVEIRCLLEKLGMLQYFDFARVRRFADWYASLHRTLGDSWVERPSPSQIFFGRANQLTSVGLWPALDVRDAIDPDVPFSMEHTRRVFRDCEDILHRPSSLWKKAL